MARIAIIGAGSVGRALGVAFARAGCEVVFGVREPGEPRHADIGAATAVPAAAVSGAELVVLAVPADTVPAVVPNLGLAAGQVVVDATNALRIAVPMGFATMGELTASLVPEGVQVVKAFNTVGAEHMANPHTDKGGVFLPIAGDAEGAASVAALAASMGFEPVVLGGRDRFGMLEEHARLWIHLAFGCGWGRQFAFTVVRR